MEWLKSLYRSICLDVSEDIFEEKHESFVRHEKIKMKFKDNKQVFYRMMEKEFQKCDERDFVVRELKNTWFKNGVPKYELFLDLSKLSCARRRPHDPEYFEKHISSVYFHYEMNKLVPYQYTLKK